MPITPKGKVERGATAREILTKNALEKSDLTKHELVFILSKLKDASYKGHEFETFYMIWVKLTSRLEKLQ